jgi:NTE family protein
MQSYADRDRYGWLHLVDGALSDNLGVRAALDALADRDDPAQPDPGAVSRSQRLVFITVNASDWQAGRIGGSRRPPDAMEMLRLTGTVPVDRYTVETKALLRETLRRWMDGDGGTERTHIVEVDLDELRDDPRFGRLTRLPTAFDAAPGDIDELRCAARRLLMANAEYRRFLAASGTAAAAADPTDCARAP